MQTSQEWWVEVKADHDKFMDWLRKQYHGEATAAWRIRDFLNQYGSQAENPKWIETAEEIARQEEQHAEWVAELLRSRGEQPQLIENKNSRYWNETLSGIHDWETGCAVAAHAEKMRLERIRVIADDPDAPEDIREVFAKILPQEEFHEKAFRSFSSNDALTKTSNNHTQGANALGLIP